jgi:hypothetical protein
MHPLKAYLRQLVSRTKPQADQAQTTTVEQMKEVVDLASEFDRLQGLPVWEKIIVHMGTVVQGELVEATKYRYEPTRQVTHTVRWDAKRELLDNVLGWIEATQRERDRIIAEFKESKEAS